MNNLQINFGQTAIDFELEMYNQIFINDYPTFLKILIKLKSLAGDKFDEYYKEKYEGKVYLDKFKLNSKNILVIDFNDFTKIIDNLTFSKTSLLRKIYLHSLDTELNENIYEEALEKLEEVFKVNDEIMLNLKIVPKEKILDLLFSIYTIGENEYLNNPDKLVDVIQKYLDIQETMKCIMIIDSSIKIIDYRRLIEDERIFILDTCIDLSKSTNNLLFIENNYVNSIHMNDLINKIELHWPTNIIRDDITTILNIYFRIILQNEYKIINRPSDTFVTLYIILRKILNYELHRIENYNETSPTLVSYIKDTMI